MFIDEFIAKLQLLKWPFKEERRRKDAKQHGMTWTHDLPVVKRVLQHWATTTANKRRNVQEHALKKVYFHSGTSTYACDTSGL